MAPVGHCTIGINVACVVTGNSDSTGLACDITIKGNGITVTSLRAETNFAGTIDLTDRVTGDTVAVTFPIVDTVSGGACTMHLLIVGTQSSSGLTCTGTNSMSFLPGPRPAPVRVPPV
jgi:hypothetical protein